MEIRDQVQFKRKAQNGNEILFGTIISFKDKEKKVAIVSVTQDPRKPRMMAGAARVEVPVVNLTTTRNNFGGRAIVQSNPTYRNLSSLISQLNNR